MQLRRTVWVGSLSALTLTVGVLASSLPAQAEPSLCAQIGKRDAATYDWSRYQRDSYVSGTWTNCSGLPTDFVKLKITGGRDSECLPVDYAHQRTFTKREYLASDAVFVRC